MIEAEKCEEYAFIITVAVQITDVKPSSVRL